MTEREIRTLILILDDAVMSERPEVQIKDIRSIFAKLCRATPEDR